MAKGYWINHVEEIIDMDAFGRYVAKWNALIERGEAKTIAMGPVAKTQIGAIFGTISFQTPQISEPRYSVAIRGVNYGWNDQLYAIST